MKNNWTSVKESGATWEPKQTGSKKGEDLKALTANDKSIIDGYYIGSVYDAGPKQDSTVHKIKMEAVGDEKHINGEVGVNGEINIWGTAVLNDQISKIAIGQYIRIKWLGKKQPKNPASNQYHNWEVFLDSTVPPMEIGGASIPHSSDNNLEQASVSPQTESVGSEEDDDLPF